MSSLLVSMRTPLPFLLNPCSLVILPLRWCSTRSGAPLATRAVSTLFEPDGIRVWRLAARTLANRFLNQLLFLLMFISCSVVSCVQNLSWTGWNVVCSKVYEKLISGMYLGELFRQVDFGKNWRTWYLLFICSRCYWRPPLPRGGHDENSWWAQLSSNLIHLGDQERCERWHFIQKISLLI